MGSLIILSERRADRSRPAASPRPAFFFDLACPFSYFAAESVERLLGDVEWVPVASAALPGAAVLDLARRAAAERRARELRLPLQWPDRAGLPVRSALRVAAFAAEVGAGHRFALAAGRLAFCGGFDLESPEVLAEAAAAAGIGLGDCLAAARDPARDRSLHATALGLLRRGARGLPAVRVDRRLLDGEDSLLRAASLLRDSRLAGSG